MDVSKPRKGAVGTPQDIQVLNCVGYGSQNWPGEATRRMVIVSGR